MNKMVDRLCDAGNEVWPLAGLITLPIWVVGGLGRLAQIHVARVLRKLFRGRRG